MGIRKSIRLWREHKADVAQTKQIQRNGQVHLYHFWGIKPEEFWLYGYLQASGLLTRTTKTIGIWSVFGDRRVIDKVSDDINVFFTGENVHIDRHQSYADHMLTNPKIQLSMGFDCIDHPKYVRFPLWITYVFGDCYTYEDVCKRCDKLRFPKIEKNKWVSVVASWDPSGVRAQIADVIGAVKKVDYAGKWRHNDDTLKHDFADNKIEYLKQYVFNICPENSDSEGYVTEKLFEAIAAGCIPIYWGSNNDPEPGIINKEAILFYEEDNGDALQEKVERIVNDESYRKEFMNQPRLLSSAEDRIWAMMSEVYNRMEQIICSK